jgi:uncharacterized repeat protein (TIGR02543 family)
MKRRILSLSAFLLFAFCGLCNVAFADDSYTLTVTVIGSGSVVKSPDQATYVWGTNVTLNATASVGWTFAGWSVDASGSVNPTVVNMTRNKAVTATFTQDQFVDKFIGNPLLILAALMVIVAVAYAYHKIRK